MKQTVFAEAIGLSVKEAGLIERGKTFPKPEKLEPIAKALSVPLKELFDYGKTRMIPPPPALPITEDRPAPKKPKQGA
jgi:transcriptional regulator with XRE-family HTH domain